MQGFGPGSSGKSFIIDNYQEISQDQYEEFLSDHEVIDTPEILLGIEKRFKLRAALHELIPVCPKCGFKMVQRSSQHGNFWGCDGYPKCKGTRKWDKELAGKIHEIFQELEKYQYL